MSNLEQLRNYEALLSRGAQDCAQTLNAATTTADIDSDDVWAVLVSAHVLNMDDLAAQLRDSCAAVRKAANDCGVINELVTLVANQFIEALIHGGQVGTHESVDGLVELSCLHDCVGASGQAAIDKAIGCFVFDVGKRPDLFGSLWELAEDWSLTLNRDSGHITDQFLGPLAEIPRRVETPDEREAQLETTAQVVKDTLQKFIKEAPVEDNVVDLKAWADRFRQSEHAGAQDFATHLEKGAMRAAASEEDSEWGSTTQEIASGAAGDDSWVLYVEYSYSKIKMTYDGPKRGCPTSVGLTYPGDSERYFQLDSVDEQDGRVSKTWAGAGAVGKFFAQFTDGSVYADPEFDRSLFEYLSDERE